MKFACIIYQDGSSLAGLTEAEQLAAIAAECKAAEVWKAELEKSGRCVFCAGLQSPATAVTVRKRNGGVSMTDGPFAETKEVLGGFIIIEARDLNEALQLTSRFVSKLVMIEVRPVKDEHAQLTDPLDQKIDAALRP